jgi:vitamin K-dependent gamma-carboxylase
MAATMLHGDQVASDTHLTGAGAPHDAGRSPAGPAAFAALVHRLCAPVDIATLVVFRIAFGAILAWEVWRYLRYGWIARYYIEPSLHFSYYGFGWVQPWPGTWMYVHFSAIAILALCIMTGTLYRLATVLVFLGVTYTFLLDQATYLNHMYLVCLVSFLMIFVPSHRTLSVDALIRPGLRSEIAPTWALWILQFQIALPYVYGGIAKLNTDWLQGEPVRMWLAVRAERSAIAPLLTSEWTVYLICYGGLLFDLLVVPLLLWRRTRVPAYLAVLVFHLSNAYLFNIGIFPWFMIVATLLFFPPDWPRTLWRHLQRLLPPPGATHSAEALVPPAPAATPTDRPVDRRRPGRIEALVLGILALHVLAQVLIPLRHWLYPGDVAWTDEGHRFSWRMKLRSRSYDLVYLAIVPSTGAAWAVNPGDFITRWQGENLDGRPDMMLQLAHWMADRLRREGYSDVEIHAQALTSLNGRKRQHLIDSTVDLASRPRDLWPADWLKPLEEPLVRTPAQP